jgi:RNA polymerase sigma-70 factor, ECF subfamily
MTAAKIIPVRWMAAHTADQIRQEQLSAEGAHAVLGRLLMHNLQPLAGSSAQRGPTPLTSPTVSISAAKAHCRHEPGAGISPALAAHADKIMVGGGPDHAGGHPRRSRSCRCRSETRLHRSVRGGNGNSATGGRFRCQSRAVIGEDFPAVLAAAQRGDEGAFTVLWRDGNPALLRYLKVIAPASAEDVTAETWVTVVRGLDRFRGGEDAWRAWLFTTALRRAVDAGRRRSRRPESLAAEVGEGHWPEVADTAEVVLENLATRAAIAAVASLPPLQAEVVMLRVVAGLDTEAVAQLVGRSPGAVRVAVHRGLRRLAQIMTEAGVTR